MRPCTASAPVPPVLPPTVRALDLLFGADGEPESVAVQDQISFWRLGGVLADVLEVGLLREATRGPTTQAPVDALVAAEGKRAERGAELPRRRPRHRAPRVCP